MTPLDPSTPTYVSHASEHWEAVCCQPGCQWRSPRTADKATARQAHTTHTQEQHAP